jgi:putative mRNA 3-end processing factor
VGSARGENGNVLETCEQGLYCPAGGFFIDPVVPVDRAVITHAHSDHARPGSAHYLTVKEGVNLLRARVGDGASIQAVAYGEPLRVGDVTVSMHPSGHILGAAQVRMERGGEVWVAAGDYKLAPDPTCAAFEPVRCHTFVTESTFALPIFRWQEAGETLAEIEDWWRENRAAGKSSVLFVYPIGKAQRVLAGLDTSIGPVVCHGSIERINAIYRGQGIALAASARIEDKRGALVLAPPSALGSAWLRQFGSISTAMASGWMRIRGTRRRRSLDRGFVLSDHADWPGLLAAIRETGAENVWVTHGYRAPLARWLSEQGTPAQAIELPVAEAEAE